MNTTRITRAKTNRTAPIGRWLLTAVVLGLGASCNLDDPQAPALSGPSTAGRAIEIRVVPETLVSDGFSSSVVEAVLYGPNGERLAGVTVRFEIVAGGLFLDLGNIAPVNGPRPVAGGVEAGPVSAVTDGDGVARARYWAPFRTDQENDITVTIAAREQSTNTRGQLLAQADIFLRAANRPSFPGTETCGFIWEPEKIVYKVGEGIAFTATQIEGANGHPIARYEWLFSDGTTKDGRDVVHAFATANTHTIILVTHESITGARETCSESLDVAP